MTATAEVVILPSSSPVPTFAKSPTPVSYSPEKLFGLSPRDDSSPSLLSPTALFRSSSHSAQAQSKSSRDGSGASDKKQRTQKNGGGSALVTSAAYEELEERPRRKVKEVAQGKKTTAVNPGQPSLEAIAGRIDKPAEEKKTRKRNTSKRQEPGNKTLKGRVSKAGSGKANSSDKAAAPLLGQSVIEDVSNSADSWEKEGLQLDVATKRRLDWTPTKDSRGSMTDLIDGMDGTGHDMTGLQALSCRPSFSSLMSTYGFEGENYPSQDSIPRTSDEGPTKRRRIEVCCGRITSLRCYSTNTICQLVDQNIFSIPKLRRLETTSTSGDSTSEMTPAPQDTKKKPRKKKMTTITAHATARYVPGYQETSGTLNRYLVVDENQSTTEKTAAKQKISKSKRKKSDDTKEKPTQFTVLHPEAAFRSLEDQELLFGTCSQLERDESPTFIREIQKAIRASETDVPIDEGCQQTQSTMSTSSGTSTTSRFTSSRNLWSVAARDSSGSLVQAEVVDLVDSPDVSRMSSEILEPDPCPVERPRSLPQDDRIEMQPSPIASTKRANPTSGQNLSLQAEKTNNHISKSDHLRNSGPTQVANETTVSVPAMPQYTGFTDAELSKQIASYGFKPVRARNKMIELLQKCWESRHPESAKHPKETAPAQLDRPASSGTAIETVATRNNSQTDKPAKSSKAKSTVSKPKPSAGRKRDQPRPNPASKRSTKKKVISENQEKPTSRFQNVEEIEDSEEELIPSPSRMWSRYLSRDITPVSLPLSAAPSPARTQQKAKESVASSSRPDDLPELSIKVMEAIRAQPQRLSANGRPCPTWHEKIVMYDPIVLEDLAVWLNTEGLSLVGEDREVSAGFVRQWCESRGICCCWKKT